MPHDLALVALQDRLVADAGQDPEQNGIDRDRAALAARLERWRGLTTAAEPLLWVLHLGYLWLPAGHALLAVSMLVPPVPQGVGLHALTAGAMATMILAMMTRATLGHTGRSLTASRATAAIYLLINCAALARLASGLWGQGGPHAAARLRRSRGRGVHALRAGLRPDAAASEARFARVAGPGGIAPTSAGLRTWRLTFTESSIAFDNKSHLLDPGICVRESCRPVPSDNIEIEAQRERHPPARR